MESVSKKIKKRLCENNIRFYASDNISDYIKEGEKEELIEEIAEKFDGVLRSLVIDVDNDPNSRETPKRLAKMYINEIMSGRYFPSPDINSFPNESQEKYEGMIIIRAEIYSLCSHHHQNVFGTAYIGIIPEKNILGLSKYIRLAQWEARRGTLQEELCGRIRNTIGEVAETENVAVYIEARHGCVECRGVGAANSLTQTCVLGGVFKSDMKVREEFYHSIALQKTK